MSTKHYYATGNFGNGTVAIKFATKKDRDHHVAWGKADNRRKITIRDAMRYTIVNNHLDHIN